MSELERAWSWRKERGVFEDNQAVRVFHGPGEGTGSLATIAIERFGSHYWVTEWERGEAYSPKEIERRRARIIEFLKGIGAESAVALWRPAKGVPAEPEVLFGTPPAQPFEVTEEGARFWIRLREVKHPGLFLDHLPLRRWLRARASGLRVLNTFAYTGSLSVAAGLGGAAQVTTLDLSKPTVRWAEENWSLNGLAADRARFLSGDVFEWLPRLRREKQQYDCVILDPPSFSRGHKGSFSTSKDLERLHGLAIELLTPGGMLITSINSANVAWAKYENEVRAAAKKLGAKFEVLFRIDQPETFPTLLGAPDDRYLKGWALRKLD